ncbi:glucosaminidase domain-containing protein [Sulfurimonas paralvinellae]|uniref:glucosaminidase domain-containing protein n=1 Tax=Sulfurimonas paralvinellae TaxID=317658 RepID=UPI001D04DD6B|nr:glucosaminidase domain-containing protein [Sulfurimonas paralvinellae]
MSTLNASSQYSLRKYQHVKEFYKTITPIAIKISKEKHVPPAAILAIAGVESGYGRGYVSQITGNILSLGAYKSDPELPALYLPYSKSKNKILFDPQEIKKSKKSDLSYKTRAPSLKKDYRPSPYAGSYENLALLKYNKTLREKAYTACINDFATKWISADSNIKSFKEARIWLNTIIADHGYTALLTHKVNNDFIDYIGGKPHSFNYRKSWPKKVKNIMKRAGLVVLVQKMEKNKMGFDEAWKDKR